MVKFFKKRKKEPENLEEILKEFKNMQESFNKLSVEFKNLKKETEFLIQKIGMVRFNPFSEIGGDQSFSLVLLDGNDNGVVVTSLYTHQGSRVYGKPIKNGKSQYPLSQEEIRILGKVINKEKINP